ncbi:hypothetical protein D3C85_863670 [compost metagenome]
MKQFFQRCGFGLEARHQIEQQPSNATRLAGDFCDALADDGADVLNRPENLVVTVEQCDEVSLVRHLVEVCVAHATGQKSR